MDTKEALKHVNAHPGWGALKNNSDHLAAYLKGMAVRETLTGLPDVDDAIQNGLENLVGKGLPHLQDEVSELLEKTGKRSGKSVERPSNYAELGIRKIEAPCGKRKPESAITLGH